MVLRTVPRCPVKCGRLNQRCDSGPDLSPLLAHRGPAESRIGAVLDGCRVAPCGDSPVRIQAVSGPLRNHAVTCSMSRKEVCYNNSPSKASSERSRPSSFIAKGGGLVRDVPLQSAPNASTFLTGETGRLVMQGPPNKNEGPLKERLTPSGRGHSCLQNYPTPTLGIDKALHMSPRGQRALAKTD